MSAPDSRDNKRRKGADALLGLKAITADQHKALITHLDRARAEHSDEGVLEMNLLNEADMLKALATHFKTSFVTTEKLSKAVIPRATLELVPRRVAETTGVFPVLFDAKQSILSVVTAEPDNNDVLNQIKLVSGARFVKAFVARSGAVNAAIQKHHAGNVRAFELLDRDKMSKWVENIAESDTDDQANQDVLGGAVIERLGWKSKVGNGVVPPKDETPLAPRAASAPSFAPPAATAAAPVAEAPPPPSPGPQPAAAKVAPPARDSVAPHHHDSFAELLSVMLSLLENTRAELRGHSSTVGRLARRVAERMNLSREDAGVCVVSALIHDLGKMSQFHLTPFNCSEYEGHKTAAQKVLDTPARLLDSVKLSPEITKAVRHMYERFDGKGFPDGLVGKDIPLASRILAVCDTYADLTQNPRNPFRKALAPQEACGVLAKYKDAIFDPHVVELFQTIAVGEDLRAKLLSNRQSLLLVDADMEETTVLELRLLEHGVDVKTARGTDAAKKLLEGGSFSLVVCEADLPDGDGLEFLSEVRKAPWGKDLGWIVYTRRQARGDAQRAFELGSIDFVMKPIATDIFVAKLKAVLDQRQASAGKSSGGVSGSLREMGIPDLVQVLLHGRKTGSLKIRTPQDNGEIHFLNGNVANALFGKLKGTDAFYAMCRLQEGDFSIDPNFKPPTRVIQESSEALLLEGMRRLDEGL